MIFSHSILFIVNTWSMKAAIKKDFLIREVAGEKVLIGSGEQVNFSKMMILNETAAFIVGILQEYAGAVSSEEIARELAGQFEVSFEEALEDTEKLLRTLAGAGVLNIISE